MITLVKAAQTAGTDAITSDILDMAGYEGVLFLTRFGTAAAGNLVKAQSGTDDSVSDAADLEGTSVSSGTSDEGIYLDIYKPQERYVRLYVTRGTSSTMGEIWAIQYGNRNAPQTHAVSGTLTGETHVSPAEGTA
jgi:hypothetical protein